MSLTSNTAASHQPRHVVTLVCTQFKHDLCIVRKWGVQTIVSIILQDVHGTPVFIVTSQVTWMTVISHLCDTYMCCVVGYDDMRVMLCVLTWYRVASLLCELNDTMHTWASGRALTWNEIRTIWLQIFFSCFCWPSAILKPVCNSWSRATNQNVLSWFDVHVVLCAHGRTYLTEWHHH